MTTFNYMENTTTIKRRRLFELRRAERLLDFLLDGDVVAYGESFLDYDDIELLLDQMNELEAAQEEQEEMRSDAISRNRALISSFSEEEDM
ncbi:MAG: hypothetical protein HRU12_01110 [Phaeodactylibacter sp.]|nr:hypothetical protein [Phaeodactylibacter sp.]